MVLRNIGSPSDATGAQSMKTYISPTETVAAGYHAERPRNRGAMHGAGAVVRKLNAHERCVCHDGPIFIGTQYLAAYQLFRTCHARWVIAAPSQMSSIPSNTPSSHAAETGMLAHR